MIAVVMTPNGTHHFISQQTTSDLYQAGNDDLVELDDGTKITPKMAGEIIPINEYYQQFPDKRPAQRLPNVNDIPAISGNVFTRSKSNGRGLMLKALRAKYPNSTIGTKPKSSGTYEPQHVFDPTKESWPEFSARVFKD